MTESERIIKQGHIPESFFNKEERCGFLITEKRKKIWAIELDIYLVFAEVCKKHNLKFWGDGGTLLGAVRHNGFIPWDDDIDVIMPRQDYNKLLEIGTEVFEEPFFLQNPHTDPNYGYSLAKLRNSNTTSLSPVFAKSGFNHGIPLDICPLDHCSLDTYIEERAVIEECIMKSSSYMKRHSVELLDERQLENFKKYKMGNPAEEYDKIHRIASNPIYRDSEFVSNRTVTFIKPESLIWKSEWYSSTNEHLFESLSMPIPGNTHLRLKAQYGNYMELPPIESRGVWHSNVIWDPDKSYTDYI